MCVCVVEFDVEVQLDRLKQQQKGAVRRALFLDTQLPTLQRTLTVPNGARVCSDTKIFLRVSLTPDYLQKQDINGALNSRVLDFDDLLLAFDSNDFPWV